MTPSARAGRLTGRAGSASVEPDADRAPRRGRPVVSVLVVVTLGLAVTGWATRWVDMAWWPLVVAQSLVPVAGIGVLVATGVAALLRRRRTAWVGAVASVAVLAVAVPFGWPGRTVAPERVGPPAGSTGTAPDPSGAIPPKGDAPSGRLVVLSSNLEYGQGDPAQVMQLVHAQDVDVLVLLELTPTARQALLDAGLAAALPHEVGRPSPRADGTVIRSRHRLTPIDGPKLPPGLRDQAQPAARVDTPGGPVTVLAVHPYPPSGPSAMPDWHGGLRAIGTWAQGQPRGVPVVLAGDFNASADHPVFRTAADGFVDAHAQAGAGWVRTWPHESRVPPFVQIDHVLGRDFVGVLEVGSAAVAGSDHAAVWAAWALPTARPTG